MTCIPSVVITGSTTVVAGTSNTYRLIIQGGPAVSASAGEPVVALHGAGEVARLAQPEITVLDKILWLPLVTR